jgi:LCP family protein required for cell wall assembly
VHARRVRPDSVQLDRRRLVAAGLSALLPGLGQAFNRRRRLALLFAIPSLLLLVIVAFVMSTQSPTRLLAWIVTPSVLSTLLTLNLVLLAWRLLATGQAFVDTRNAGPTGRLGIMGVVLIALLVVLPHAMVVAYGSALQQTFADVFEGAESDPDASPVPPALDERVNVLIIGIDKTAARRATLTDTMMVVSLDPVAQTVSMVSIPRDMVGVPLGDGDVFGPKINSLLSYAERHPDEFPDGGVAALQGALGALLGIEIDYYAQMDFDGFRTMVDAVGGIDVDVERAFSDPEYDGRGFSITAGPHHLDGKTALAYVRSRKADGESDFTRAARQQQVLLGLRDAAMSGGSLLWELPGLLDAVGGTFRTDVPVGLLPQLAAVADEMDRDAVTRAVIRHPLVRSERTQYGSSLVPDVAAILAMAAELFPDEGGVPVPWPTPEPTEPPEPPAGSSAPS